MYTIHYYITANGRIKELDSNYKDTIRQNINAKLEKMYRENIDKQKKKS